MTNPINEALRDWHAPTSGQDLRPDGPLSLIFRDSGWSNRVDVKDGKARDWCGMAVAAWNHRAGTLAAALRREFWHTTNVEAFFSYGRHGTRRRHHEFVVVDGQRQRVEDWHAQSGALRGFLTRRPRSSKVGALDLIPWQEWGQWVRPGDVLLIAHRGQTTGANHIAMVERVEGPVVHCLDGNARGIGPDGRRTSHASVVRIERRIDTAAERNKIYMVGRLSPLDSRTNVTYEAPK
jgi:hypothetical protein